MGIVVEHVFDLDPGEFTGKSMGEVEGEVMGEVVDEVVGEFVGGDYILAMQQVTFHQVFYDETSNSSYHISCHLCTILIWPPPYQAQLSLEFAGPHHHQLWCFEVATYPHPLPQVNSKVIIG